MSSKKPPKPDPAQQELARTQAATMREQTAMSRDQFAQMMAMAQEDRARGDQQFEYYRGLQDEARSRAQRLDDRYWSTTARQEDAFYDMVDRYDTSAERDRMAGAAISDIEGAAELGRGAMGRGLAARGLNAGSAAAITSMMDGERDTALAKAAAATASQAAARERGFNLRAQAAGLGGNLQGQSAGYLGQAGGFGGDSLNAGTQGLRSASAAWSGLNQGMNTAMGWGSAANSTFGNINQYNLGRAQAGGNSGLGSMLGGIAGSFFGPMGGAIGSKAGEALFKGSDRRLKKDIRRVGELSNGIPLYLFRYIWNDELQLGVMADEVEKVLPHAVHKNAIYGMYDAVDYGAL